MEPADEGSASMRHDPVFETVWAPPGWAWTTDGPVRYVTVTLSGAPLGQPWAACADDAAGFIPGGSSGALGKNATVRWVARLREAKARGLSPLGALREWAGRDEDAESGFVPEGIELTAGNLADLTELAANL
ncbi:hypothetical protein [Actinomadura sp. HBU206391]|uniref:hypothetical protein n=1 Tax=Actinomadura sp. HBU206391 TaxID=2731692 RepID=UPI00164F80A5|nr:hypothetical protein [Actinomadura sp. HBU206391]MBC6459902.1 hypothetical protein [Actinomadura sp. HBU206391]